MAEDNAEFAQIWADAFSLYQEKTKRDLKGDPVLTNLWTTDDLLKQIEVREQNFQGFREKKAKLWAVLRRSMMGVEVLGGLTQNALTLTPFSMASPVLGAVLFLVGSAKGVSEAYDSITTLLSKLEDFTGRLQEYTRAAVDLKLKKKVVDILTTLLEIFARSEKLIKNSRIKQYMSVTFLGSNEKVASAMTRLNSLIDTESRLVGSLVYSTVLKTNETVDRSEKTMERNEKALQTVGGSLNDFKKDTNEKLEQERLDKLDKEVLGKVQDRHNNVLEQMLEGTGNWIKEEPLYKAWINEEEPILWIFGGPGAGKSFLSSKIVSNLLDLHAQDSDHPARISVGYFYIKESDERLRSVNAIFKSVALQLANDNPVYKKHVVNVCESRDRIGTAKSTWQNLFLDFFGSQQNADSAAFVVIDGLDEAPKAEREMFLELLRSLEDYPSLRSSKRPRLSFAIVGRPELRDTIAYIWESRTVFIEVSAAKNRADIEGYINDGIGKVRALKNKRIPLRDREKLRADIVNKLKEGANGMFLWVNLMLDQISDVSRPSDIRNKLEQAPHDLAKMIRHVFERLAGDPSVQKDDFNEMLTWITFARTPLLLGQMDVILKLRGEFGEGMPDLEDRLRDQFSSFFTLEREDNMTTQTLQPAIQDIRHEIISHEEHSSGQAGESHDVHQTVEDLEDEDYISRPYDSDPKTTLLGFSHASIRDYLVQEGRPTTRKYPVDLGIGIDVNKAEHHITATCLSILCDTEHESLFFDNNMLEYAADNFLKHLQKVDKSSLSKQEKKIVLRPLFTIFQDDSIMERWIEKCSNKWSTFVQSWLKDSTLARCVRDWFTDEDNIDFDFTAEEKEHLRYASRSDSNLFERLARYCASQWLSGQGPDEDPEFYVWVLHVYLGLNDESSHRDSTEDVSLLRLELSDFPLKRLRFLAEYGGFEQNAYWHRRLAKIYRDAAYINAATKEFSISIKMDDQDYVALEGMAFCYEKRKDYLSAIEWHYKALAALPKESRVEKAEILQQISEWKTQLEDKDGAIEASHAAYSLSPQDIEKSTAYLSALEINCKFQAILDFAAKLEKINSAQEGENMLTFLFVETWGRIHDIIGNAARRLGRTDSVEQPMRDALAAVKRRKSSRGLASTDFALQFCFLSWADFLNKYAYKMDEAIEIYETALELSPKRTTGYDSWSPRILIKDRLCQLYYHKAKAAECAGNHVEHWVTKLEGLAKPSNAKGVQDVSASEDSSLMLGLWYRLHGREQEAKLCFRTQILNGIDTLTDDDPGNDIYGYMTLALALLKAGDRANAGAAFAVTTAPIDRLKDSRRAAQKASDEDEASKEKTISIPLHSTDAATLTESLTSSMEKSEIKDFEGRTPVTNNDTDDNAVAPDDKVDIDSAEMTTQIKESDDMLTNFPWGCDGNCRRRIEDWQEVHFCEICIEYTLFCDECVKLVKTGTLPFRKCDEGHTFYQGYPLSKEMQDVATVRTEGEILPRKEWLESLRKECTA